MQRVDICEAEQARKISSVEVAGPLMDEATREDRPLVVRQASINALGQGATVRQ